MITIRRATNADLARVVRHVRELWAVHDPEMPDEDGLAARCREILRDYKCFLIDHDGEPLAFASLQDERDGTLIRHFTVLEVRRGQGHGRAAFEALAADVFPGRKSRLYVSPDIPRARRFWERMGYRALDYSMERQGEKA